MLGHATLACILLAHSALGEGYGSGGAGGGFNDAVDLEAEGNSVNDPGMDGSSKACRYDEGKGWSDCDPFELIRYKVLRLVHGGSQCEDMKNITKHCTPHDFPYGTHWLIQEHRKCISELNRLKAMIGDLSKFIERLNDKGKELFDMYMKLKTTFDELTAKLEQMKNEGVGLDEALGKLKEELQSWKDRARDLQKKLEELRAKFHDLETEEHEVTLKNDQLTVEINIINKENEALQKEIERIMAMNDELKRRIVESERTKEKLEDLKVEKQELQSKLEKVVDKLQDLKDKLAELKINLLAKKLQPEDAFDNKDTHVDMSLEMFIVHNKSNYYKPEPEPIYYTTEGYIEEHTEEQPKCLISYYGTTNETCWYETEGEKSEDYFVDALGHHLVEAHWKYFTIDVKDQNECDKASQLHYEFLLNRCSPKHFLPVLSVFKKSKDDKELATHVFPASDKGDKKKACWITFLGAHGHCEKHKEKYSLYNTPDLEDANAHNDKKSCLSRQDWWQVYCDTPVLMTYVPGHVSTNWAEEWIMHDSHGGRMFEDADMSKSQINPDSLNPEAVKPGQYKSVIKSEEPLSPDYHDSPEYRKSLHLEGKEKEAILVSLRSRLGLKGPVDKMNPSVKIHPGVDIHDKEEEGYGYEKQTQAPYETSKKYEEPKPEYSQTTEAPYMPTEKAYGYEPTQAPYEMSTEAKYETSMAYSEEPKYETPKPYSEEPKYEYPPSTEAPYKEQPYEEPKPAYGYEQPETTYGYKQPEETTYGYQKPETTYQYEPMPTDAYEYKAEAESYSFPTEQPYGEYKEQPYEEQPYEELPYEPAYGEKPAGY